MTWYGMSSKVSPTYAIVVIRLTGHVDNHMRTELEVREATIPMSNGECAENLSDENGPHETVRTPLAC